MKLESCKTQRIKEGLQNKQDNQDKGVKKSAWKDKINYSWNMAEEAETAAEKGDMATVYKISREQTTDRTGAGSQ